MGQRIYRCIFKNKGLFHFCGDNLTEAKDHADMLATTKAFGSRGAVKHVAHYTEKLMSQLSAGEKLEVENKVSITA